MGIIKQLDYETCVLVAAGEMIERPVSVVKELVENSIDAGASKITVELQNGGVSLIRCTDNGSGMAKEDLPLCIKRNATSKIERSEDISHIMTLGFRGEAMASIAAVSDLRIRSKRREDDIGCELEIHPGMDTPKLTLAPMSDGTTIIVENLFANLPARRKFLKKDSTEAAQISDLFYKLAISNPHIAMSLIIDGKQRYNTLGDGNLHHAIYSTCGSEFARKLISVDNRKTTSFSDGTSVKINIHGFIGTPDNNFGSRQMQIFYVNGRHVRSRCLQAALEESFVSYLDSSRYPSCVLFVEVPPEYVDVNIHPTKLEVKFYSDKPLFEAMFSAVRAALNNHIPTPEFDLGTSKPAPNFEVIKKLNAFVPMKDNSEPTAPKPAYRNLLNVKEGQISVSEILQKADEYKATLKANSTDNNSQNIPSENKPTAVPEEMVSRFSDLSIPKEVESIGISFNQNPEKPLYLMTNQEFDAIREKYKVKDETSPDKTQAVNNKTTSTSQHTELQVSSDEIEVKKVPEYRIIGEAFLSYLIIEVGDKILMIDKHAAHERIIFEELRRGFINQDKKSLSKQTLLMPLEIPMNESYLNTVKEYSDDIESIGFEFSLDTPGIVKIHVIPTSLSLTTARDVFEEITDKLANGTGSVKITNELIFEKALYQASCKAAIKVGREYNIEHLKWICDKLLSLDYIKVCPHGRPVAFEMSKSEIERQFKRI